MNLLFFQNCISPHQVPYIKEFCHDKRVAQVCLIVPRTDYQHRKDMGWDSRHLLDGTNVRMFLLPPDDVVKNLFLEKDTYAFFLGIRADADVFRWLKLSLAFDVKRGIITEAPNIHILKPLPLHCLRFLLQDYRFVKRIHYVFAFGSMAAAYYRFWSKRWKVVPFSYCTEVTSLSKTQSGDVQGRLKLLYVGALIRRKDVGSVLKVLASSTQEVDFHIVGDGLQRKRLEHFVHERRLDNVVFRGCMEMQDVHSLMPEFDVLVLPSRYDGWGAVINEALQCGLYVICSDKCGAKDLLVNERIGCVFRSRRGLASAMSWAVKDIQAIRQGRLYRMDWSQSISGKSLARYFVDSLFTNGTVVAPWKRMNFADESHPLHSEH